MPARPEGEIPQSFESGAAPDALDTLALIIAPRIQEGYDIRQLITDYDTYIGDVLKLFNDDKLTAALIGQDLRRALVTNDHELAAERLSLLLTHKPSRFDAGTL